MRLNSNINSENEATKINSNKIIKIIETKEKRKESTGINNSSNEININYNSIIEKEIKELNDMKITNQEIDVVYNLKRTEMKRNL